MNCFEISCRFRTCFVEKIINFQVPKIFIQNLIWKTSEKIFIGNRKFAQKLRITFKFPKTDVSWKRAWFLLRIFWIIFMKISSRYDEIYYSGVFSIYASYTLFLSCHVKLWRYTNWKLVLYRYKKGVKRYAKSLRIHTVLTTLIHWDLDSG